MPTPCGENCSGPMPILGMTFQPNMCLPSYGGPMAAQAADTMRPERGTGWGETDDLRDLRAVHRGKRPFVCGRVPGRLHLRRGGSAVHPSRGGGGLRRLAARL